jgi:molecular chaperone DnaK (HSP70)
MHMKNLHTNARGFPAIVAWNDQEQLVGEAAYAQAELNVTNTIYDISTHTHTHTHTHIQTYTQIDTHTHTHTPHTHTNTIVTLTLTMILVRTLLSFREH